MPAVSVDSLKILIAGSACILIGAGLLFLQPDNHDVGVGFIVGGVGLLAPGAFRLGAK